MLKSLLLLSIISALINKTIRCRKNKKNYLCCISIKFYYLLFSHSTNIYINIYINEMKMKIKKKTHFNSNYDDYFAFIL